MEITAKFARYVSDLRYENIPAAVIAAARRAFVDTLGCAVAGSMEPAATIALQIAAADGGSPEATVIAAANGDRRAVKVPAPAAAMTNAIAGHALDYDDVNPMGHPSVPVVFAALAAAQATGASGRELLTAYVAGVEVETKIMHAFSDSHYLLGWHSTSTLGVLGAAAAGARLYGLDADQTAIAFGIAASQASGLRQNFGTMTKPFHPGHAAWSGLQAARLARLGFSADPAILEASQGYFKVFSAGPYDPERAVSSMNKWALLEPGLSVKKYPCCYCTHASIDAALALSRRLGLDARDVASIHAELSPFFLSPLIHHRPATALQGKFSLEYTLAAALIDGKVRLASFTDKMVNRPEAQALIEKITSSAIERSGDRPRPTFVRLAVELQGGRREVEVVPEPRGTPANPLSDEELEDKLRDCFEFAGRDSKRAETALEMLWGIDRLGDLEGLTAVFA